MLYLIGEIWFSSESQTIFYNLGLVLWIASELGIFLLSKISERKDHAATIHDRMSISGIMAANIISCLLALFGAKYMQVKLLSVVAWAGIVLLYTGVLLRISSVWILRRFFTVSVKIKAGHRIIRKGPYKYLRHPSYSGSILALVGMQMGIRSVLGFVITVAIVAVAYSYRIRIEEAALLANFGAEYEAYKKHTKRMIPFIY